MELINCRQMKFASFALVAALISSASAKGGHKHHHHGSAPAAAEFNGGGEDDADGQAQKQRDLLAEEDLYAMRRAEDLYAKQDDLFGKREEDLFAKQDDLFGKREEDLFAKQDDLFGKREEDLFAKQVDLFGKRLTGDLTGKRRKRVLRAAEELEALAEPDFFIPAGMTVREYARIAPAYVLCEYRRDHVGYASPSNTRGALWGSCGPTTPFHEYHHLVASLPLRYMGRINNNPNDDTLCRKPFYIEVYNVNCRRWIRVKVAGVNYGARGTDDIGLSEKAYALIGGRRGPRDRTPVVWRFLIRE
jgi:hypothetical protein